MQVVLHRKEEFRDILRQYAPSEHSINLLKDMPLVVLQGIAGGGRNTIIDYLVKHKNFHQIISDTTRPPKIRDGNMEKNGVQYFFRTEDEMLQDLKDGLFLEAELIHNQQVSGNSIRELSRAHDSGKIPINEVAREGISNVLKYIPNATVLFVIPPSYDEWVKRLSAREQMSEIELRNRRNSAKEELQEALTAKHFRFVVNDSVERAASVVEAYVNGSIDTAEDSRAKDAAREIVAKLDQQN